MKIGKVLGILVGIIIYMGWLYGVLDKDIVQEQRYSGFWNFIIRIIWVGQSMEEKVKSKKIVSRGKFISKMKILLRK